MSEQVGNLITFLVLAATFGVKTVLMLRRTRRWNGVGRALTASAAANCLLWCWFAAETAWAPLRTPALVWSLRVLLVATSLAVVTELARMRPSGTPADHHPAARRDRAARRTQPGGNR